MDKKELVRTLENIGILLELQGENPFKSRAYANAARALEGMDQSPEELVSSGALKKVKGVGAGLQEKITLLVETGKLDYYEQLKKDFPSTLFELFRVPGLGPKKVKILYENLAIKDLQELRQACRENRLAALEGFGEKSQEKIFRGAEMVMKFQDRFLISQAEAAAGQLLEKLKKLKEAEQIETCGSLRRGKETIGDVDLLVATTRPEKVMAAFFSSKGVEEVIAHGQTKSSIRLESGLQVDLRTVSKEQFPFALQYFTGSKEHNTVLRGVAKKKGYKLNEYGLYEGETSFDCTSEAEIYEKLDMAYIPPELRENTGEIEAAQNYELPELIQPEDMQGLFHVHSNYSDGKNTIEEMALAARGLGFKYLGLADHSQTAFYAGGLKEDRIKKQHEEIDYLNEKLKGLTILKGIESDILKDGSLDYQEKTLESFDFVIASVHSSFQLPEKEMTDRICKALENPFTTMLGHATGRLLLGREGYSLDMARVLETAAEHKKIIELNASPYRLDLDWRHCKTARQMGILISINPDSHTTEELKEYKYGVMAARRGWLSKEDVFNTRPLAEVEKYLKL